MASPPERFQALGRGFRGCKLLENRREEQQIHLFFPGHLDIVQAVARHADNGVAAGSAEDLSHASGPHPAQVYRKDVRRRRRRLRLEQPIRRRRY